MPSTRRIKKVATTVAFAISVAFSSSGQSAEVTWIGPTENLPNWNIPTNWVLLPGDEFRIPGADDDVFVLFPNPIENLSQTVQYINPGNNPILSSLQISGDGVDMTLNQQQDALSTSALFLGGAGLFDVGAGGKGIYNLGGTGTLTVSGDARVGYGGTGTFNQTGGIHTVENQLILSSRFQILSDGTISNPGTGTYNLSDGNLTVAEKTTVGLDGQGTFNQSGGTHETRNLDVGRFGTAPDGTFSGFGDGTYNFSGGKLTVSDITRVGRGGKGTFEQSGGTFTTGSLSIGVAGDVPSGQTGPNEGAYRLSGTGSLTAGTEIIGNAGTGTFNQTGGSNTVTNSLVVGAAAGSTGTYTQSGGTATAGSLILGEQAGSKGSYELSGGALTVNGDLVVGQAGTGVFTRSGGTLNNAGNLIIAQSSGSNGTYNHAAGSSTLGALILGQAANSDADYNLSGTGNLITGAETVGAVGTGTFIQTGNTTHTINGPLILGEQAGSKGSYELSGGALTVNGDLVVGQAGTGIFTRSGGTLNNAGNLIIAQSSGSNGTYNHAAGSSTLGALTLGQAANSTAAYNLSGTGNLTTGAETVGAAGSGNFNQTGGIHGTNSLSIGEIAGSTGVYNLTGGNLDVANAISVGGGESGTLNVAGGALTAAQVINSGTLNYSGGTISTDLTNTGTVNLSGTGSRIFDGDVANQGTFKVTDTTAVYNGNFDNQGAYFSDPSVNNFQNLNVGPQGYLAGGPSDTFIVTGNFANSSTQNTAWKTEQSNLVFAASPSPASTGTPHQMALPSADLGPVASGFKNNFAWNQVTLNSGERLALVDGNSTPGAALYTSSFALPNGLTQLNGISGDYNIYYDPDLPENQYLSRNAFNFGSGIGQLIPEGFTFLPPDFPDKRDLTVNEKNFGIAIDSACQSPTGVLAERCRELRVLNDTQRQEAIANLTPIQQLSQTATPIKFNQTRMDAPKLRMAQLRSGNVQFASLSFNGYQIPLAKFGSAPDSNARGGAAGDSNAADEPYRDKPFGVFVQGQFNFGNQSSNPESPGFNLDSRAVTVGSDYRFTDKLVAGAAIEYNNVHTSFNNGGGSMQTDTIMGALYSSLYLPYDFYVDGLATFGNNNYALTRTISYPGFSSRATSNHDAFQYAFAVTAGKDIAWKQWLFNPYTRFEYTQLDNNSYQESGGGGFAMDVGSQTASSAISTLGTQVSYNFSQSWGILVPSIRVEWEHQYLNNNQNIPMTIASAGAGTGSFVIQTGQPDRDYVNLGGSISATLPGGGSAFLRYDTRLGQSFVSNHIVELGIKIPF